MVGVKERTNADSDCFTVVQMCRAQLDSCC